MALALCAYVGADDDGTPYWTLWTAEDGQKRGLPKWNHTVRLGNLFDGDDAPDYFVGLALASAALGSKLLRLSSEINAIRPLFVVRDVLGGADK
jgi:hypothetical protein